MWPGACPGVCSTRHRSGVGPARITISSLSSSCRPTGHVDARRRLPMGPQGRAQAARLKNRSGTPPTLIRMVVGEKDRNCRTPTRWQRPDPLEPGALLVFVRRRRRFDEENFARTEGVAIGVCCRRQRRRSRREERDGGRKRPRPHITARRRQQRPRRRRCTVWRVLAWHCGLSWHARASSGCEPRWNRWDGRWPPRRPAR